MTFMNKTPTRNPAVIPMRKTIFTCFIALSFGAILQDSVAAEAELDTAKIDEITGLKGKFNKEENVYKVSFPRTDVKVIVENWQIPPFMGLGTWAAFKKAS